MLGGWWRPRPARSSREKTVGKRETAKRPREASLRRLDPVGRLRRAGRRYYIKRMAGAGLIPFSLPRFNDMTGCYPLGGYDMKGKRVVDVGCDWGMSPIFWRSLGASKVIGYEVNEEYVFRMGPLRKEAWFEFRGGWDREYPDGDVFKIDCEGCEAGLDLQKLKGYSLWFVAIHRLPHLGQKVDTLDMGRSLAELGGEIVHTQTVSNTQAVETVYRGGKG